AWGSGAVRTLIITRNVRVRAKCPKLEPCKGPPCRAIAFLKLGEDFCERARLRSSRNNQSGRDLLRGSAGASPSQTLPNLKNALALSRDGSRTRFGPRLDRMDGHFESLNPTGQYAGRKQGRDRW